MTAEVHVAVYVGQCRLRGISACCPKCDRLDTLYSAACLVLATLETSKQRLHQEVVIVILTTVVPTMYT